MRRLLTFAATLYFLHVSAAPAQDVPAITSTPYRAVTLFFAGEDGLLAPENVGILRDQLVEKEIKTTIDRLSSGSVKFGETIPKQAALDAVFIDRHKTAYLDFNEDAASRQSGGITQEIIAVASICKTVFTNFDLDRLRFLLKGKELKTLAGHVDLEGGVTRSSCDGLANFRKP